MRDESTSRPQDEDPRDENRAAGSISRADFLKTACKTLSAATLLGLGLSGCGGGDASPAVGPSTTRAPETQDGPPRNQVVVISDLHMGDQRSIDAGYGWLIKNENRLATFLSTLASSPTTRELVIAGDLFDEWVIPMDYDTFNGFGSDPIGESRFFDSMVAAHPTVVAALNKVIASGIKVTYIPGNHDMLVTEDDLNRAFPGIHQKRDAPGIGSYSPDGLPEIVIEHSHRYDFSAAPDMYSNRSPFSPVDYTSNARAILPPGFFATKIGASSGLASPSVSETTPPALPSGDYALYWAAWQLILRSVPASIDRSARQIKTDVDGYTGLYAIDDLVPQLAGSNLTPPMLYQAIEDNWTRRQLQNKVNAPISVASGILSAMLYAWDDNQSSSQYFSRDPSTRVVIFGHTHHATLVTSSNARSQKCICANSGTWIDNGSPTCTFVVITPQGATDTVSVCQYTEDLEVVTLYSDSLTKR